jgi:hypothetical protein
MPNECPVPVRSQLAKAAKLTCRGEAVVLTLVPMVDRRSGLRALQPVHVCLSHSVEIAVWKLIESLPRGSM